MKREEIETLKQRISNLEKIVNYNEAVKAKEHQEPEITVEEDVQAVKESFFDGLDAVVDDMEIKTSSSLSLLEKTTTLTYVNSFNSNLSNNNLNDLPVEVICNQSVNSCMVLLTALGIPDSE